MTNPNMTYAEADEIANEAVDAWSNRHPHIRLNLDEWADLKEAIIIEIRWHNQPENTPNE